MSNLAPEATAFFKLEGGDESGGHEKMVNGEVLAPEAPGMSSQPEPDFIANHKVA